MKKLVAIIPNTLTLTNMVCGCGSIYFAFGGNFQYAFWAMLIAAAADFADGFAARLLKAYSPLGAQLDSLSDMVSFGVAPTMIVFNFLILSGYPIWAAAASAIFVICAALRLAKFNIDTNQSDKFIGVPSPAAAIAVAAFIFTPIAHLALYATIFAALMMVAPIEMMALKFKDFSLKNNIPKYLIIVFSISFVTIFGLYNGLSLAIGLYILGGIVGIFVKR